MPPGTRAPPRRRERRCAPPAGAPATRAPRRSWPRRGRLLPPRAPSARPLATPCPYAFAFTTAQSSEPPSTSRSRLRFDRSAARSIVISDLGASVTRAVYFRDLARDSRLTASAAVRDNPSVSSHRRSARAALAIAVVAACVLVPAGAGTRSADPPCKPGSGVHLGHHRLTSADFQAPADVRCADLAEDDLSGFDLGQVDLTGANLAGANLQGTDLTQATLSGAKLDGADLTNATADPGDRGRRELRRRDDPARGPHPGDADERELRGRRPQPQRPDPGNARPRELRPLESQQCRLHPGASSAERASSGRRASRRGR